jgi:hypothetical protein
MIKHVVFLKFKSDAGSQAIDEALDRLRALPAKISVIRSFEVGRNIIESSRAWDAVLIGEFNNLADLEVYAKHDDHVAVARQVGEICEAVGSVDYQV